MEFTRKSKWSGKVRTRELPIDSEDEFMKLGYLDKDWLLTGMTPEEIDEEQESRLGSDENKRYHK